jgi:hypothetical protein
VVGPMVKDEHRNGVVSREEVVPITAAATEDGGEVAPSEVHNSDNNHRYRY